MVCEIEHIAAFDVENDILKRDLALGPELLVLSIFPLKSPHITTQRGTAAHCVPNRQPLDAILAAGEGASLRGLSDAVVQ